MKLYKIGAVLLALTLLTGCGKPQEQETTTQPTETTAATTTEQIQTPEISGIPVETPYMTFYCPEDWKNTVEWELTQRGSNTALTFRLTTVEKQVELFSLELGPEETAQGYYLGYLDDTDGKIHIYSEMNEQDPSDWSEEDYMEICYQQERVNDLILQLHEDPRFKTQ